MIARLADGVSLAAATAEANVIGAQLRRSPPTADSERQRFSVARVTDQLVAPVRPALLVLGQGAALAGLGIALGLIGALNLTQYLRAMLFGLGPSDPTTFVVVALTFAGIATFGCYLPARRATRLDPLTALREE